MNQKTFTKSVKVFFLPGIRRIYVYFGKMIIPTSPNLYKVEYIRYRTPTPEFAIIFLVIILASLQLAPLIGLMSAFFLVPTAWFILYASNKKKSYLFEKLRQELPEQIVIDVAKKGFSECSKGDRLTVTIETESTVFDVVCGHPGKCVEYDKNRSKIFATVVSSTAVALITTYILKPDLLIYTLAPLIIVLILLSKYNLCKNYSIVPIAKN
ncbi:MAG: hypothetical protein QXV28_06990 [Ignisphaera sp.]